MCEKIWNTLVAEPPANNIAMHNRKLPAGIAEPGIIGWLCHVLTCFGHFGLEHVAVTTAFVPTCLVSNEGLSVLQTWQKLNSNNSWDKNTMCFGSVRRFLPAAVSLYVCKRENISY